MTAGLLALSPGYGNSKVLVGKTSSGGCPSSLAAHLRAKGSRKNVHLLGAWPRRAIQSTQQKPQ